MDANMGEDLKALKKEKNRKTAFVIFLTFDIAFVCYLVYQLIAAFIQISS